MPLDLSHDDIAALEERAETRDLAAGEVLIREAEAIQGIFLIRSGSVEVAGGEDARFFQEDAGSDGHVT